MSAVAVRGDRADNPAHADPATHRYPERPSSRKSRAPFTKDGYGAGRSLPVSLKSHTVRARPVGFQPGRRVPDHATARIESRLCPLAPAPKFRIVQFWNSAIVMDARHSIRQKSLKAESGAARRKGKGSRRTGKEIRNGTGAGASMIPVTNLTLMALS